MSVSHDLLTPLFPLISGLSSGTIQIKYRLWDLKGISGSTTKSVNILNSKMNIGYEVNYKNIAWITAIFILCAIELITEVSGYNLYLFSDDAYYYFTIARNTLHYGFPTFDASTPTNGFHPLWLVILFPIFSITSNTSVQFELIRILQILLAASTLILVHRSSTKLPALPKFALILLLFVVLKGAGLDGMETTLTMFLFMLFYFLAGYTERSTGTVCLRPAHYFFLSLLFLSCSDTFFFIAPIICIDLYNQIRRENTNQISVEDHTV